MDIALAIILHPSDNTILIAQRRSDVHLANFWEFPGGKQRSGETLEECIRRESLEEVGLVISIIEQWPSIPFTYPERTVVLHPFLCRAETSEAQPLDNQQVAWVATVDLGDYAFPEANRSLITYLKSASLGDF